MRAFGASPLRLYLLLLTGAQVACQGEMGAGGPCARQLEGESGRMLQGEGPGGVSTCGDGFTHCDCASQSLSI